VFILGTLVKLAENREKRDCLGSIEMAGLIPKTKKRLLKLFHLIMGHHFTHFSVHLFIEP
jgi:hypothetical protein